MAGLKKNPPRVETALTLLVFIWVQEVLLRRINHAENAVYGISQKEKSIRKLAK